MIDLLKNLFFVRTCLGCGTALPDADADTVLCEKCYREYLALRATQCDVCKQRTDSCRCIPVKLKGKVLWSAHLFDYEDALSKRIIFTLKLKNYLPLQRFLAKELADLIFDLTDGDLSDYSVSFVPRKPKSICIYGFDQSRVLAERTASYLYLPVANIFGHRHFSRSQKTLNARQRVKNADSGYFLKKNIGTPSDKLLIFDDIATTGSTLSALVSLAETAGYREVAVVCVARDV